MKFKVGQELVVTGCNVVWHHFPNGYKGTVTEVLGYKPETERYKLDHDHWVDVNDLKPVVLPMWEAHCV